MRGFIIWAVLLAGCVRVEPIEIIAPKREIDTGSLEQFKSSFEGRNISIGLIYGWGKLDMSNLMNTPDSLDVIVVKDGYETMSDFQKKDLSEVKAKKATRVLLGVNLDDRYRSYEQDMESRIAARTREKETELQGGSLTADQIQSEIDKIAPEVRAAMKIEVEQGIRDLSGRAVQLMQSEGFNGISVETPQSFNEIFPATVSNLFLEEVAKTASKGKSYLLAVENAYSEAKDLIANNAEWVIYRRMGVNPSLSNFDNAARNSAPTRFLPSVDLSSTDSDPLVAAFPDSPNFSRTGGVPQATELTNWNADNSVGAAYYHIERNYLDIAGNETYKTLRYIINRLQLRKPRQ